MKKALCVGIDSYDHFDDLTGCVNDANSVKAALERNGDGSLNFEAKLMCATSESNPVTKSKLEDALAMLFKDDAEIALFYFAGHGTIDDVSGYLLTSECADYRSGLALSTLMGYVSRSKARNNIIILDSCCSGGFSAVFPDMPEYSQLKKGTTILAACGSHEGASEIDGRGVFTSLMIEALYGGSMNLVGDVTPGSIYSYIDGSLGGWGQRPVFKANINSFVSLRKNSPPICIGDLRRIAEIFENPSEEYPLDPTYEPDKHEADIKDVNKEHELIFSLLQKYVKLNLVVPVGEEHMYYAAIHHKACKLTALGQHYWQLVRADKI